jgi:hypothetical protein
VSPLARFVVPAVCLSFTLFLPGLVFAEAPDHLCRLLPPTIQMSPSLRPVVMELLRRSPTFARQCATIAAARHVRITIVVVPPSELARAPRARAVINRHAHGLIRALIEIPATADFAELLPHEFEHVIEQLEGLSLSALHAAGHPGVVEVQTGVFETTRARNAGRAAAREFRDTADPVLAASTSSVARALGGMAPRAAGPGTSWRSRSRSARR